MKKKIDTAKIIFFNQHSRLFQHLPTKDQKVEREDD